MTIEDERIHRSVLAQCTLCHGKKRVAKEVYDRWLVDEE